VAVRLYSGKVVIRSLQAMHGWKDIVLAPGEEMVYDDHRMMVKVNKPAARGGSRVDSAGGMGDLVFNNSPLKTVFQRLSQQYHKKIVYRASELEGLNFTGTLMRTDSLETILSLLGSTNNLDIHEQPAGFVVTRHKDNP
jgi:ferric-dicitrate binding protein FerR (iron transport regulator)